MPELPDERFLDAVDALVASRPRLGADGDGESLYLRPLDVRDRARAAGAAVVALPVPACRLADRRVLPAAASSPSRCGSRTEYVRAAPGGTGEAKCAGNYAASLVGPGSQAHEEGCDQVVWLDAVDAHAASRRWAA